MTRTTTCTKSQAIMQKAEGLHPPRINRHPRRKVKRAVSEITKTNNYEKNHRQKQRIDTKKPKRTLSMK